MRRILDLFPHGPEMKEIPLWRMRELAQERHIGLRDLYRAAGAAEGLGLLRVRKDRVPGPDSVLRRRTVWVLYPLPWKVSPELWTFLREAQVSLGERDEPLSGKDLKKQVGLIGEYVKRVVTLLGEAEADREVLDLAFNALVFPIWDWVGNIAFAYRGELGPQTRSTTTRPSARESR